MTTRSSESGIALVIAMFMTLVLSVIASSLMFVSKTETVSSYSYKTMSQARYAAESGLHSAANHLLWKYQVPDTPGAPVPDPIGAYDITGNVVRWNGQPVVLSSDPAASNYPIAEVVNAFATEMATNTLAVNPGNATFTTEARLVSMRQFPDAFTNLPVTLQTWEITGRGRAGGLNAADVEVTAIIERQDNPTFKYAAFATDPGCDALRFGGGAIVDSYDSSAYAGGGPPATDNYGGNVGTNGNMTGLGNTTTVKGSLSTPRSGVGNCTAANVTAFSTNGATVTGGILELGQAVAYPTPPVLNPLPPTGNVDFNGGCGSGTTAFCTTATVPNAPLLITLDPTLAPVPGTVDTVRLGDVRIQAGTNLHLKAGTYEINSLVLTGNSTLTVDPPGEVIIKVAGVGEDTPINFTGGSISNNSYDPSTLQIRYSGTGNVKMTGGTSSAALVYAPNASASLTGGANFYGAVVAKEITDMGGAAIHYDRQLQKLALTAGNPMMGSFTWKTF